MRGIGLTNEADGSGGGLSACIEARGDLHGFRVPRPTYTVPLGSGFHDTASNLPRLAEEHFMTGEEPYAIKASIPMLDPASVPVIDGAVARYLREHDDCSYLFKGPGWTMLVAASGDSRGTALVSARTLALAEAVLADYVARLPQAVVAPIDQVKVEFFSAARVGHNCSTRLLTVPVWADIRRNYPGHVARAFDRLVQMGAAPNMARLVLLHGVSGTGKTTAVRALLRAWAGWCTAGCVVDPERFFADMSYFNSVMLQLGDERAKGSPDWSLLVIEDADELVKGDAKRQTGQGLARLLNLTDGLMGQGLKVLVLITTNERLNRIHPAISRPGRCLANIEFGRLDRQEAAAWLGYPHPTPAEGLTLAELLEARGDFSQVVSAESDQADGAYL